MHARGMETEVLLARLRVASMSLAIFASTTDLKRTIWPTIKGTRMVVVSFIIPALVQWEQSLAYYHS
jgi:hypothetical protein